MKSLSSAKAAMAALSVAVVFAVASPATAWAGDCTGYVVGVRPISQYNHSAGNGFLAVRNGPGGNYRGYRDLILTCYGCNHGNILIHDTCQIKEDVRRSRWTPPPPSVLRPGYRD